MLRLLALTIAKTLRKSDIIIL